MSAPRAPGPDGTVLGDGALHLASDPRDPAIDPAKECYPCGPSVGAIEELVPASDLVRRFMAEAADALARLDRLRSPAVS